MSERLYKRGDVWWAWYYDTAGNRIRRSTRCRDNRAAEAVLRRWERGAQDEDYAAANAPQTVTDATDALLDEPNVGAGLQHMREIKAGHLARLIGTKKLAVLTTDDLRNYCATRTEEGASASTVAKELSTLSQALRVAVERNWWKGEPKALLPRWRAKYTPRKTWLTRAQVDALCGELEPHRARWVRVAVLTGARDSEIESFTWNDVDHPKGWLDVRGTKTAKSARTIPIGAELRRLLDATPKDERTGRLVEPWGNVRRDLHAAAERAGVPAVSPNDLRRTFASWLKQAGVDSAVVGKLLGHTSSRMVEMVYGHLSGDSLQKAIGKLPKAKRAKAKRKTRRAPRPTR